MGGITVKNLIVERFENGILVFASDGNTLTNNTVRNNTQGISLGNCRGNTLKDNVAIENTYGIHLENCEYNTLANNTANSNSLFGIYLLNSSGNILIGNTIKFNPYGTYLAGANNNEIYNNDFISNIHQAVDSHGSGNIFNLAAPKGGNYWDNYDTPAEGCSDTNADGFCDAPYFFSGGQDNLPWYTPSGWKIRADAGPDQVVDEGTLVTLDGSRSTGQNLTFSWTQLAGLAVTLNGETTATPSFTAPLLPGGFGSQVLTFQLTVTSGNLSSSDTVDVTVKNINHAPVAEAGMDQTVNEGSLVILDGSASYDPDGDPITYEWVQISGPTVTLSGADTAKPKFTAPMVSGAAELLVFALTVSDKALWSTDQVQVTVEKVNHPPIADAGTDQTKNEGNLVVLDGTGSYDPDSDPLTYRWSQVSGPSVALSDPQSARPTFTAPTVGPGGAILEFQLVVNDPWIASGPDTVVVTVQNENDPPACHLAQASPELLWPPNHKLTPVGIVGVTDPSNGVVTITITRVTQDEPLNGLGDGDTSPDAVLQGGKVLLRAERSGLGNGRVYRIYFTADDGRVVDGVCIGSVTVGVPLSMKKGVSPVDDGELYDSTQP